MRIARSKPLGHPDEGALTGVVRFIKITNSPSAYAGVRVQERTCSPTLTTICDAR